MIEVLVHTWRGCYVFIAILISNVMTASVKCFSAAACTDSASDYTMKDSSSACCSGGGKAYEVDSDSGIVCSGW